VGGGVTGKNGFAGLGGNAIEQAIFVARSKPIFVGKREFMGWVSRWGVGIAVFGTAAALGGTFEILPSELSLPPMVTLPLF
jgi:hypothetical protein